MLSCKAQEDMLIFEFVVNIRLGQRLAILESLCRRQQSRMNDAYLFFQRRRGCANKPSLARLGGLGFMLFYKLATNCRRGSAQRRENIDDVCAWLKASKSALIQNGKILHNGRARQVVKCIMLMLQTFAMSSNLTEWKRPYFWVRECEAFLASLSVLSFHQSVSRARRRIIRDNTSRKSSFVSFSITKLHIEWKLLTKTIDKIVKFLCHALPSQAPCGVLSRRQLFR